MVISGMSSGGHHHHLRGSGVGRGGQDSNAQVNGHGRGSGVGGSRQQPSHQQQPTQQDQQPVTVDSLDADFLPLIYDVVKCIEKEVHEGPSHPSSKSTSSSDYHIKVQYLKEKMDKFRQQVTQIKGIDISKEEQMKRVTLLQNQLTQKRQLLSKYKNHCPIDGVPKV